MAGEPAQAHCVSTTSSTSFTKADSSRLIGASAGQVGHLQPIPLAAYEMSPDNVNHRVSLKPYGFQVPSLGQDSLLPTAILAAQ